MKTALFVGRFQPFHKGHGYAIKSLLKKFDKVIIAVGSINRSNDENPYTFAQRKQMIDAVLKNYRSKYKIIGIPDTNSDQQWVNNITKKAKFDIIVTRNAWTKKCFSGFNLLEQKMLKPKIYDASRIRLLMKKGKQWKNLVPREALHIIKKSLS
jgi:nicotinamide-nucleotide adenylyltransferase